MVTKSNRRVNTLTKTLDPERLGLSGATHAKGYIMMDPSWYNHALPTDRYTAGPAHTGSSRAGSSILDCRAGCFIVLRSCSSKVHPGGIHKQSLGGQEPLVIDQIHQLQCCKKRGEWDCRFLYGREGALVLVSPTLPATEIISWGNFASHLLLLASTVLSLLPLVGKEMLQRNQHNSCQGKAFKSNRNPRRDRRHYFYPFMDLVVKDLTSVPQFLYLYMKVNMSFRKGFKHASCKAHW